MVGSCVFAQSDLSSFPVLDRNAALNDPANAIRVRMEMDAEEDGFLLSSFSSCRALDLSGSNLPFMPLGMKNLSRLELLNLSHTNIKFPYGGIKRLAKMRLKTLVLINTEVSEKDIRKIRSKLGITVITSEAELPSVFHYSNDQLSSTQAPNTSNTPERKAPQQSGNGSTQRSDNSVVLTDENGTWYQNPDGLPIKANESIWMHTEGDISYAVKREQRHGILNTKGQLITFLPEDVDFVNDYFSEGLIAYYSKSKMKYGYLDTLGNIVIEPTFESARPFLNGLANVKQNDLRGFIDRNGKWVIEPAFGSWNGFESPHFAFIKFPDEQHYGIVTRKGEILCKNAFSLEDVQSVVRYDQVWKNQRMLCQEGFKYGYKDLSGNWVIDLQFSKASPFVNGIATVEKTSGSERNLGVINTDGEIILPYEFFALSTPWIDESAEPLSGITIAGEKKDGTYWLYNGKGQVLEGPVTNYAGEKVVGAWPYKNGLRMIETINHGDYGDIHPTIKHTRKHFLDANDELVFYIDTLFVTPPNNDGAYFFANYEPSVLMTAFDDAETAARANEIMKDFVHYCGFIDQGGNMVSYEPGKVHGGQYSSADEMNISDHRSYTSFGFALCSHDDQVKMLTSEGGVITEKVKMEVGIPLATQHISSLTIYRTNEQGGTNAVGLASSKSGDIELIISAKTGTMVRENHIVVSPAGYVITKTPLN